MHKSAFVVLLLSYLGICYAAGEGKIRFWPAHDLPFDPFSNQAQNGDNAMKQFFNDKYAGLLVYSPSFDQKTVWYPEGYVYYNAYAIYKDTPPTTFPNWQNWVLKDVNGAWLYIPWGCSGGTCPAYAGDIGNPEFRNWVLGRIHQALDTYAYRGLFVDDVALNYRISYGDGANANPVDPRTGQVMPQSEWRRYFAEWMELIRTTFPNEKIIHNAPWYLDVDQYVLREIRASDYMLHERGINDQGLTAGNTTYGVDRYFEFNDWLHTQGVHGIDFNNVLTGNQYDELALVAFLMFSDGSDFVGSFNRQLPNDFWAGYAIDLGNALNAREKWTPSGASNYLWKREFNQGWALFNPPSRSAVTISLPAFNGHWTNSDGVTVTSVTLGAKQGAILKKIFNGNPPAPPGPVPSNAPTSPPTTSTCCSCLKIFEDASSTAVKGYWSGNGALYSLQGAIAHSGTKSIEISFGTSWSVWLVSFEPYVNTATYVWFEFWIRTASGTYANLVVKAGNSQNQEFTNVPLTNYIGGPVDTTWRLAKIPLADIGANIQDLSYLVFIDGAGVADANRKLYVDDVRLSLPCSATPTPAPTVPCVPKTCAELGCGGHPNDGCGLGIICESCCVPVTSCTQLANGTESACGPQPNCGTTIDCGSCSAPASCISGYCKSPGTYQCSTVILILEDNPSLTQATFAQTIADILFISVEAVKVLSWTPSGTGLGVQFQLCGDTEALADQLVSRFLNVPAAALAEQGIIVATNQQPVGDATIISPDSIYSTGGSLRIIAGSSLTFSSSAQYQVKVYGNGALIQQLDGVFISTIAVEFVIPSYLPATYQVELYDLTVSATQNLISPRPSFKVYECVNDMKGCESCLAQGPLCGFCKEDNSCVNYVTDSKPCLVTSAPACVLEVSGGTQVMIPFVLMIIAFFLMAF